MPVTKTIDLVANNVVSWYAVSQAANSQSVTITSPTGVTVVNTTVHSTNLSNFSIGSFTAGEDGEYNVVFGAINDVRSDEATITNKRGDTVCNTYQFAGEDGTDGDYNDIFLAITWYKSAG